MTYLTPIIIIFILLINFLLYKKNKISKKSYIMSSLFILLYSLITILIYYNNLINNYEFGILYGDIANNHFCDEYKYFKDSDILLSHLRNGDFLKWFNKELPIYEFIDPQGHASYGNYNIFVIILTLLKSIGINSTLDLILLKLIVYIPTFIYLYKLSRIYLNEKFSLISVFIFSILPSFILTNSLLMRDNIILALIIVTFYYLLSKDYTWKSIPLLIIVALLLFEFRSYSVLVFIATSIFIFKNNKRIISIKDIIYIAAIICTIYFFVNFNFQVEHSNVFFSFFQITYLQELFRSQFGSGFMMIITLFYQLIVHTLYNPPFLNFLSSGLIYLVLYSLGNILVTVSSLTSALSFAYLSFKTRNDKLISLLKFTFYFTVLSGLIVLAKDLFIIARIALMWLPLFIIILLYIIEHRGSLDSKSYK